MSHAAELTDACETYQLQQRRIGRNKRQPPRFFIYFISNKRQPPRFFIFLFLGIYQLQQRRSGRNKRQPRVKVHY
jgi:hypothetical protein